MLDDFYVMLSWWIDEHQDHTIYNVRQQEIEQSIEKIN